MAKQSFLNWLADQATQYQTGANHTNTLFDGELIEVDRGSVADTVSPGIILWVPADKFLSLSVLETV